MKGKPILFNIEGDALSPETIKQEIVDFGDSYNNTVQVTIKDSRDLVLDQEVFLRCTARILSNFKMTRGGRFKGLEITEDGIVNDKELLLMCWNAIGEQLIEIKQFLPKSDYSRDRYLLQLSETEREELITKIWLMTKELLPFTMGETSYGLVGASKILFAILPEIVLPIDNKMWLKVFQTVDMSDVINRMVSDTREWENTTQQKLNEMDSSKRLTTIVSVYNVMAMAARKNKKP